MKVKLTAKNRKCGFFITVSHAGKLQYHVELHHDKYEAFNCEFKSLSEATKAATNYSTWTEQQFEEEIKYSSLCEQSTRKLESLKMTDDLLNVKTNDLMHDTTAKSVLEAVLPYVSQLWGKLSVKEFERILDDKHLALCFSRYYPKQLIISFGYHQETLYCDLDRTWFNVEF